MWSFLGFACAAALVLSAPETKKGAGHLTPEEAEAMVREISAEVERIRRLPFKTPVAVEIVDGATAREEFSAGLDEKALLDAKHTQHAWAHLGLIPPDMDVVDIHLDLAEEEVLGYYEVGSKTFKLLSHVDVDEVRSVMAHELTHALEDQHYDLEAFQKQATNEDHLVAIRSVVEGSAMVTTLTMLNRQGGIAEARQAATQVGQARAKSIKGAPTFIQRRLLMPYTLGFTFLLRGRPWEWLFDGVQIEDIERAYAQPPHSTRQILHPEQYWIGQREGAPPLELADLSEALGPGWSQAATGSIGELGLSLITGSQLELQSIDTLLPTRWTTVGSAGTAGDLYHHYVNDDRKVTILLTRWETLRDADQFRENLRGAGTTVYRLGANILVMAGDLDGRGDAVAVRAAQGLRYWAGE